MDEYVNCKLLKKRFRKRLDWLKKDIHDTYTGALYDGCVADTNLIDEIPAADVVPVVRCKDCKYAAEVWSSSVRFCMFSHMPTRPDDFCSCAERKDGSAADG